MKTQVVSVVNRVPDRARESYYRMDVYLESLKRVGVEPTILGMNQPWHGLMTKPRRLRQWLRSGECKADTLICCDAFDIVFTAHPNDVAERYDKEWPDGEIVFNAEKGIFPRGELAHLFPDRGTPWRYLNSGFFIGSPDRILALLEAMWLDDIHDDHQATGELDGGAGRWVHPNDQGHYQYAYCAQVVPQALDYRAELCQTLSACEMSEFDLTKKKVRNVLTGTEPMVWHFNGGSKDLLMPTFLEKWGLA